MCQYPVLTNADERDEQEKNDDGHRRRDVTPVDPDDA